MANKKQEGGELGFRKQYKMTGTPGGKVLVGTKESEEPTDTNDHSPIKAFKGYK